MKEVIHIEIMKSEWKANAFNIRIGDIKGSIEHSNCSREDLNFDIQDAINDLISTKNETNSPQSFSDESERVADRNGSFASGDNIHQENKRLLDKDYAKDKLNAKENSK